LHPAFDRHLEVCAGRQTTRQQWQLREGLTFPAMPDTSGPDYQPVVTLNGSTTCHVHGLCFEAIAATSAAGRAAQFLLQVARVIAVQATWPHSSLESC
jgi:hypothetical protein